MIGDEELTLTIHGLPEYNEAVDGEVFAAKFQKFMKGLAAADEAANGKRQVRFLISDLSRNTATASVREKPLAAPTLTKSGMDYYASCLQAIYNDTDAARQFDRKVVKQISDLNKDVGKTFALGEIKATVGATLIRIDEFLQKRAARVLADIDRLKTGAVAYYTGRAYGAFDGTLKVLDSISANERAVLVLTAGGKSIECMVSHVDTSKLKAAYKNRCVVTGMAHYSGENGFPVRIEATDIEVVVAGEGMARWQGAFKGLTSDDSHWD